ncbi:MAG TPA: hypothetical protein VE398_06120 [Acidobacteriota bacterium]|nr:hypothetical protein [Acidobacteriota bacterium]
MMNRREFLGAMGGLAVQVRSPRRISIESGLQDSSRIRLARAELLRGLHRLGLGTDERAGTGRVGFAFRLDATRFKNPESYSISARADGSVTFSGASEQALLYAVFDFLEKQGAFFGIDGESYPLDPPRELILPKDGYAWDATPRFAIRGLLPWPDFLNCITVYNTEDFQAYFESMLRMRFNTFGMHVYSGASQWAESYLSFEYGGAGHLAFLDTTATNRWGYLPQRTSRYTMGGADFYAAEVFGSDATRLARDPWEIEERTRDLLKRAYSYAERLGIKTGIGFEPYQIPDEIVRALPPEARRYPTPEKPGPRFDMESVAARDLLEERLGELLEAYPGVDYVWLWEDEQMNWDSRRRGEPLSVTPFLQAHKFLQRHAPQKRLVVSGWGGVARHFESFHQRLPLDIIFTCLSDSLGWDTVHEVFGKLEGRERWPIPWLEDDPSMWLPQFHVHRFERDMNRALQLGCQGLLGIHWRHRIVDPTAGFQARFSWDGNLTPAAHFLAYARTQAAGGRVERLSQTLLETDRDRKLLSTFTGEFKDGHAVTREFSGDYNEGFTFWNDYAPEPAVVESQKQVAASLRAIADEAASPAERERVEYLAGHVEFLVPYAQAWAYAHRMHQILKAAAALKEGENMSEARSKVRNEAVPLWLALAPQVRSAILRFQSIVSNRNDLGALASMHNKFVRLALIRLRLSMKEYLEELPADVEDTFKQVTRPDPQARPRLFIPTRPSLLARNEQARLTLVSTGTGRVQLHTRAWGEAQWNKSQVRSVARKTYEATLGPFQGSAPFVEYFVSCGDQNSPTYIVTLV